ncbi:MAG TPA: zf-TFIIB domain-containing protein [Verrucomicrobiae bacterium]|nr:zf-TFIIB domain-containing protein [Verrucomicrobiae bacterium]
MPAETLNCPMCGAPASSEATRCEHCGARLATVACPSCFGMMFVGAKFCSHCGARADRTELDSAATQLCPRCRVDMKAVVIGGSNLRECPRCEGVWADATSLQQICADREKQAAVLGMANPLPEGADGQIEQNIRYLPCPVCTKLMNRVNFARCSHVVVDVCAQHGTWFDKDELRRIVEFIRSGGLDAARARELADLEEERRRLKSAQMAGAWETSPGDSTNYGDWGVGISAAAEFLNFLLRK